MRRAIILIAAIMSYPLVSLGDEYYAPPDSVWLSTITGVEGSPSEFTGNVVVSGEVVIYWEFRDEEAYKLNVDFYPHVGFASIFPLFKDSPEPNHVGLGNPAKAVNVLINDKDIKASIIGGSSDVYRMNATLELSGLFSAIDCNYRSYITDLKKTVVTGKLKLVKQHSPGYSC